MKDIFVWDKGGFVIKYTKWTASELAKLEALATSAFNKEMVVTVIDNPTDKRLHNSDKNKWYEPSTKVTTPFFSTSDDIVDALEKMAQNS